MDRITLLAVTTLIAAPAYAETWINVVSIPWERGSTEMVGYVIDVDSKRSIGSEVYARGRWSRKDSKDVETLRAQCNNKRLKFGAEKVQSVWVKKVGDNWHYDEGFQKGAVMNNLATDPELTKLKTKVFEFLCG